jgi:hypothetical protein
MLYEEGGWSRECTAVTRPGEEQEGKHTFTEPRLRLGRMELPPEDIQISDMSMRTGMM